MPASPMLAEIARDLRFPEGPVALDDGSLLLVEIERQSLTRIDPDGRVHVVADLGGGPNGAAIGPDGRVYVCNNGGMSFLRQGPLLMPALSADGAPGGWIDAVDLTTGSVSRLFADAGLRAPNDLVFDRNGGFWFTDHGKTFKGAAQRDRGAVYYATIDGKILTRAVFPMEGPNGIGLSPDGETLYVAESTTARIWAFEVAEPGALRRHRQAPPWNKGRLLWAANYFTVLDSMAVDADGHVCVGEMPEGSIVVISPSGECIERHPLPDACVTNLCFGGPGLRTAYIALSSSGRLVSMPWPRAGLQLHGRKQ